MNPPSDNSKAVPPSYGYPSVGIGGRDEWSGEWMRVVLEKLWLIVLVGIAGFFAVYGWLAHQAPLYQATGTLQVQPPRQEAASRPISDSEPNLSTTEELNTLVQGLQRPSFLLTVANDPALQADPFLFPPKTDNAPYTDEEKIERVTRAVHVALEKGTLLIFVSATDPQPATAQRLCDAMLENFVKERMETKSGTEEETYQFLLSEADRLGRALAEKEREIQKYDQLAKLDQQIEAQKAFIAQLGQRYKDKYPVMIEAHRLLQSLQDSFDAEAVRLMHADVDRATSLVGSAPAITDDDRARILGEYQVLKRDIDTQRAIFESLSAQKNQSDVVRAAQEETAVRIGDHPILPEVPESQNAARMLLAGVVLGAALGVALAFFLDGLDRSIRTVDQVETLLDLPVLSAVPEMARPIPKQNATPSATSPLAFQLPMLADGNSPPAEAIRSLRASMSLLGPEHERRSLIFTSALPGEGKSFTAANYSIALASQDLRTLLVDADLRRPSVHNIFGADRKHLGLVDYFLDPGALDSFITTTSMAHLDLLLSGTPAPNPAELLSGQGFARLISEALQSYDRIVVDTAPINVVSDTLMLVHAVQSVCVVVRAASSPGEAVRRAVRTLDQAGKRPVGIVFNRVPRRAGLGYHANYYYHYGPAHRYGNGYGVLPT